MHFRFPRSTMRCMAMVLLLCAAGTAPALAAPLHPALWKAHDSDTTVYFFGTVHAMKPGTKWHFPTLDKALGASKLLYIEATNINPMTVRPLVLEYGLDRKHPLSGKLDKKENALLAEAAKELGIPGGTTRMDAMKPWLAAITIAASPILKAGYDPKLGIDRQLEAQFKKADKPVKGFETAKQQLLFLATLPDAVQLKFLKKGLHDYEHAKEQMKNIVHAWETGDVDTLGQLIVTQVKDRSPKLYRVIILKRNEKWSHRIAKLMQTTPGTIFVAVGSGHLVGPDRLQVQLGKLGINTTRVND